MSTRNNKNQLRAATDFHAAQFLGEHPEGAGGIAPVGSVVMVQHSRIKPMLNQPRTVFDDKEMRELKSSIANYRKQGRGWNGSGIFSPLTLYCLPKDFDAKTGFPKPSAPLYTKDGERRWRVTGGDPIAQERPSTALPELPAIIEVKTFEQAYEENFETNRKRKEYSPLEEAHALVAIQKQQKLSDKEMRAKYGEGYYNNRMAMLGLSPDVQRVFQFRDDAITSAQRVDKVKDRELQSALVERLIEGATYEATAALLPVEKVQDKALRALLMERVKRGDEAVEISPLLRIDEVSNDALREQLVKMLKNRRTVREVVTQMNEYLKQQEESASRRTSNASTQDSGQVYGTPRASGTVVLPKIDFELTLDTIENQANALLDAVKGKPTMTSSQKRRRQQQIRDIIETLQTADETM